MRVWSICVNTFREAVRQPVYILILAGGSMLIYFSQYFTFFALGEEKSMIKEMGLATVSLSGLLLAVFASSSVIADEIEKLTVLTILSKPVRRDEFVVGKFFGVALAVLLAFVVLGTVFVLTVWVSELPFSPLKVLTGSYVKGFDIEEKISRWQLPAILWWNLAAYVPKTGLLMIKALVLAYFQAVVIVAIAVAVSTHLPMIVNMVICASVYAFGHISNALMLLFYPRGPGGVRLIAETDKLTAVELVLKYPGLALMKVLRVIAPNLENFNVWDEVAFGAEIPASYIGTVVHYGVIYCVVMLLVAVLLFRAREVA